MLQHFWYRSDSENGEKVELAIEARTTTINIELPINDIIVQIVRCLVQLSTLAEQTSPPCHCPAPLNVLQILRELGLAMIHQ